MKKKLALVLFAVMMVLSIANPSFAADNAGGKKDIVDTAVAAGNFKILAAALEKAGLVETLKGEGPYTVFAPTDEAFNKLLKDLGITADELLARKDLKDILLYHVLPGKVMSGDLKDGMQAQTLAKKNVTISLDPVRVNDAKVITPDVEASNGVIHVIDKVLLPK
ncbi:fasciclin domain-containing protein [Mesobacillus subterraneus]|uniref:fasciclin domain-containing protein n=1 Tax=Mesobacillus subterraneus TaxID=285983 RepID=UPI001CFE2C11|nr:fasciclin domain-containing protein [Mesobacillus subterraneus]WLR54729.1 fasciclin domain-containing protein [Mesobacillus subterraneus]